MARALFHIGLHKTGTTSFQKALTLQREELRQFGIVYAAMPAGGSFVDQHADLPMMLIQGRADDVRTYFTDVIAAETTISDPLFVFSSEEFSNLVFHQAAMKDFKKVISEYFAEVRYFLVLRNAIDHTASELRQRVDGGAITPTSLKSEAVVLSSLTWLGRKVRILLDELSPITLADYGEAVFSGDLNNFFASKCFTSFTPVLPNLRLNAGSDRDELMIGLLLSQLRSLLATVKEAHPYANDVDLALRKLIDVPGLAKVVRREEAAKITKEWESKVREIVKSVYDRRQESIVAEVATLPDFCRRALGM